MTEHRPPEGRALDRLAISATAHCLTGCAIGEVLGLVIGTALGWDHGPTIVLAVALAVLFGSAFTIVPVRRAGLTLRAAVGVAPAADHRAGEPRTDPPREGPRGRPPVPPLTAWAASAVGAK